MIASLTGSLDQIFRFNFSKRIVSTFFALLAGSLFPQFAVSATVTYLEAPRQSLSAIYKSISLAQKQIDISYYEAQPCDTVTKVLVRAVKERKQQVPGLRARFIFDAHPITEEEVLFFPEHLRQNGIEARIFNNTYKWNPRYNHRNHAKYVVADGRLITGGRNLTDNYFGMKKNETNWIDGDVLIEDKASSDQARKHFNLIWANNHTYEPEQVSQGLWTHAKSSCLAWGQREQALLDFLKSGHQQFLGESKAAQCSQVKFVADDLEFSSVAFDWEAQTQIGGGFEKLNRERIEKKPTVKALVRFLQPANRLTLVNHIYIPFGKIGEIIQQKRNSGVPIALYTNYYRGSGFIFEDVHNYYTKESSRGSQKTYAIGTVSHSGLDWEFSVPGIKYSNHAKLYIVNGRDVAITSQNFDPRSYMHNVESGAYITGCPELAGHIEKSYAARLTSGLSAQERAGVGRRLRGEYDAPVTTPDERTISWLIEQFL